MLSLNGNDLLIDSNGEIAEFIKKYVPTDLYYPWRRPSFPGFGTAGLTYPRHMYTEPPFVLNRMYWPCTWAAQRWAYMHVLASSDMVGQLNVSACDGGDYFALSLQMGNPETGGDLIEFIVYMLPPTPLSGIRGLTGAVQSLYLLTLVDVRYFLNFENTGDITSALFSSSSASTWNELFTYLVNQSPLLAGMTWDTISPQYLYPSKQMFNLPYEPLPQVLDAVAYNVGQKIMVSYNGTFSSVSYATAYTAYSQDLAGNPQRVILSGGQRYANPL